LHCLICVFIIVSSAGCSVLIVTVSSSAHIRLAAAAPPPPKTLATTTTRFRIATIIIPTASIDRCHPHPHYCRHNVSPNLGFLSMFHL
jgi:hypothetical protein